MVEREPQLGRLVAVPLATIGILAAVLVWQIEHIGSLPLGIAVAAVAVSAGVVVCRRMRKHIEEVSAHYESLLRHAEAESRRAEAAGRTKDEFLATLSHELRTPLNSILGWARLLGSGKLDADQGARAIGSIERAGWTQARVIEDLLDMSRLLSGTLEVAARPTLLPPLVDAAIQSIRMAAAAKGIEIRTSIDPKASPITADPHRVQQIVWNLLSNAIKFTPPGGRVTITVCEHGGHAEIAVSDTGIGFDPETASQLFERFHQADSSTTRVHGGLGLGLGIVRHLVELHGGIVTAKSEGANTGSTFTVRLPLASGGDGRWGQDEKVSLLGVSVLVVDDDPFTLDLVRSCLEHYGASVKTASSVMEARTVFVQQPPDVLVSDVRMPGQDGLQLIREIRSLEAESGRHTPAAALTALSRDEDRQRTLGAGFDAHVPKPVDPAVLAAAVEGLVHHRPSPSG